MTTAHILFAQRPRLKSKSTSDGMAVGPAATETGSKTTPPKPLSAAIQVVRNGSTKLRLREQTPIIQAVIREAINRATEDVVLRKAWPEENARTTYGRDLLMAACRNQALRSSFNRDHLEELRGVLKGDSNIAKVMGNTVRHLSLRRHWLTVCPGC